jgi:threonine synthase
MLADVTYLDILEELNNIFLNDGPPHSMWRYFSALPLRSRRNIITAGEGLVPVERWQFLENFARAEYNVECHVYAHRQDNNYATGSFKDLAGSLLASVLKENGIREYVVASTGNIGVAFARYISHFGGRVFVFIPSNSPPYKEGEISVFGQKVYRVSGDYTATKKLSIEFANSHKFLAAVSGFDPMRIEAKKTMSFEWRRAIPDFPTVYVQALSGGTGSVGVMKGCKEMLDAGLIEEYPRLLLVQSDRCSPMADAWTGAKSCGFQDGWQHTYPIVENPITDIPTLATGNPSGYPVVADAVRTSRGEIFSVPEAIAPVVGRFVAHEVAVRIGPAAAVAVGGFFYALKNGFIKNDDRVVINIGEGIRRDPDFMLKMMQPSTVVSRITDCRAFNRDRYARQLWSDLTSFISNYEPSSSRLDTPQSNLRQASVS